MHKENEKFVRNSGGVKRLYAAFAGDFHHKLADNLRRHAGLLIVLHAADGAGNAPAVDVVAENGFLSRCGKARFDVAGLNGAHADSEGTQLVRQRHRVRVHRGLRSAVICLERNGYRRGNAAYIYDFSAALTAHNRNDKPIELHHAEKIRIEKALRFFGIGKFNRAGNTETGVVYHKVNAPFGGENLFHRRGNAAFIGYVRCDMPYFTAAIFVAAKLIHDPAAAFKGKRGGFANAGVTASYYCNFVHKNILAL